MTRRLGVFRDMNFSDYWKSLRYSLYTMRRPLTGFWDLVHEKRGSLAAAHTIVAVAVIVQVMRLTLTNFQFIIVHMEVFNVVMVAGQILMPLLLWVVANWCLTTLMDGKGKLSEIYMGTAYALTPMVLIDAFLIPVSHFITFEEGAVYWVLTSIAALWFVLLLIAAMMEIHDYSLGKTLLSSFLTIIAIAIIVFIFIMFFAVVSDGIMYFVVLAQELMFRFDLRF